MKLITLILPTLSNDDIAKESPALKPGPKEICPCTALRNWHYKIKKNNIVFYSIKSIKECYN
jgi:hypothetical protein